MDRFEQIEINFSNIKFKESSDQHMKMLTIFNIYYDFFFIIVNLDIQLVGIYELFSLTGISLAVWYILIISKKKNWGHNFVYFLGINRK